MENGVNAASGGLSIEKMYQKKTQLEHILLRPDTYIGSVEYTKELMWVFDQEKNHMIQRDINFVPGLYKIFDEILVNAADNKQRDKNMNTIKIEIDQENNRISVWNNGKGIPVTMHKDEKMYVPTMIFGHLLTSSNYNDEEKKVTGGRNGYGAKLCNIFSTSFTVETASREYRKTFKQTWTDNMSKTNSATIGSHTATDFTKITFTPDLSKFKMEKLEDDIVALMSRRAYDVAASSKGVTVFLNGNKLNVKNFKEYIELYVKSDDDGGGQGVKIVHEQCGERWEIACCPSDRGFQQVSFVNSIATYKGGRHVDHVVDNIIKKLIETLNKKNKGGISIKPFQVRNHIWVFVNCLIENPTFDSQTKENMTLQSKGFGSKCVLTDKFITNVSKSGIIESVLAWAKFKAENDLAKTGGRKSTKIKGFDKLEDANEAGTKNSIMCTLILTEGDSAKSLAVSGLGVVGRDYYGVFPLKGKLLNVREASHKQLMGNKEIEALYKIIGLQHKKKYLTMDDLKTLRYGKVMIMTDQDQDGSHIKGLLINFIHTHWPDLLKLPFLEEFITPIVKVTKKTEVISFYSLPEFEEWKNDTPNHHTYAVKYYKGLGTSTSQEAKEYFSDMDRHRIVFKYDGAIDDESITMAFSKKHVEQRKDWLRNHMDEIKRRKLLGLPERYLYTKATKEVTYSDFVNLELILFSNMDNERSIPCLVDGFKPGQRKVMFTCFKRNDKKEVKVAQLSGSVAEMSAYHHGETSLQMTIVNLAQDFVGSNNLNLLEPRGQFGTRLQGGKDSASARYIFTMMSPLTRLIFHPADDPLLTYNDDDGQRIEPQWYIPIIPMVLVNGAEGIGTGWSTKIYNHNPRDIIKNIRRMLSNEEPKPMHPWYRNYKGVFEYISDGRYVTSGNLQLLQGNKLEISELPIGTWTQAYRENVLNVLSDDKDKKPVIKEFKEYHTDTTVRFVITFAPGEYERIRGIDGGFHQVFKISSTMSTNQMHCFDEANCLRHFATPVDILKEYFPLRLSFYQKRKDYMEGKMAAEAARLTDQARFIMEKCDRIIVVENKKRKAIIEELLERGYKPDPVKEWQRRIKQDVEEAADDTVVDDEAASTSTAVKKEKKNSDPEKEFQKLAEVKNFDYLLGMSMWMLTEERKNELLRQRDLKLGDLKALRTKTIETLWLDDLDDFEMKMNELEEEQRKEALDITKKRTQPKSSLGSKGSKKDKTIQIADPRDQLPDPKGKKIAFKITEEIKKKVTSSVLIAAKSKEKSKKKAEEKPTGGDAVDETIEELDEFDALVEGKNTSSTSGNNTTTDTTAAVAANPAAATKVKKETGDGAEPKKRGRKPKVEKQDSGDKMKQSKLTFVKKEKKPAVRKGKGGGSTDDDFDDGIKSDDSDVVVVRETRPGRRAVAQKVNYSGLLDSESDENDSSNDDDDDAPLKDPASKRGRKIASLTSDSDEDAKKKKKRRAVSSDDDFVGDDE